MIINYLLKDIGVSRCFRNSRQRPVRADINGHFNYGYFHMPLQSSRTTMTVSSTLRETTIRGLGVPGTSLVHLHKLLKPVALAYRFRTSW